MLDFTWHTFQTLWHIFHKELYVIRKARLYARVKQGLRYPRVAVDHDRNGRAIQPKGHVTTYMVRRGGMFENVGRDFALAVTRLHQMQAQLHGVVTPEQAAKVAAVVVEKPRTRGRIRLADAVDDYNEELKTLTKGKYTIAMYKNALDGFAASYKKTYVDEIDRKDIVNYIAWMKQNLKIRVRGGELRTYRNRLGYLGTFLKKYGIQLNIPRQQPCITGVLKTSVFLKSRSIDFTVVLLRFIE